MILIIAFIYIIIGIVFTFIGSIGIPVGKLKIEFTNTNGEDGEYLGFKNILCCIVIWPIIMTLIAAQIIKYFVKKES